MDDPAVDTTEDPNSFGVCPSCTRKDEELAALEMEQATSQASLDILKQKFIAKDQLLRQFKAKSLAVHSEGHQDLLLQYSNSEHQEKEKQMGEWVRKYEKTQREVAVLEAQLRKSVEDMESMKKTKENLELQLKTVQQENRELLAKLSDHEFMRVQYERHVKGPQSIKVKRKAAHADVVARENLLLRNKIKHLENRMRILTEKNKALKRDAVKNRWLQKQLERKLKETEDSCVKHPDPVLTPGVKEDEIGIIIPTTEIIEQQSSAAGFQLSTHVPDTPASDAEIVQSQLISQHVPHTPASDAEIVQSQLISQHVPHTPAPETVIAKSQLISHVPHTPAPEAEIAKSQLISEISQCVPHTSTQETDVAQSQPPSQHVGLPNSQSQPPSQHVGLPNSQSQPPSQHVGLPNSQSQPPSQHVGLPNSQSQPPSQHVGLPNSQSQPPSQHVGLPNSQSQPPSQHVGLPNSQSQPPSQHVGLPNSQSQPPSQHVGLPNSQSQPPSQHVGLPNSQSQPPSQHVGLPNSQSQPPSQHVGLPNSQSQPPSQHVGLPNSQSQPPSQHVGLPNSQSQPPSQHIGLPNSQSQPPSQHVGLPNSQSQPPSQHVGLPNFQSQPPSQHVGLPNSQSQPPSQHVGLPNSQSQPPSQHVGLPNSQSQPPSQHVGLPNSQSQPPSQHVGLPNFQSQPPSQHVGLPNFQSQPPSQHVGLPDAQSLPPSHKRVPHAPVPEADLIQAVEVKDYTGPTRDSGPGRSMDINRHFVDELVLNLKEILSDLPQALSPIRSSPLLAPTESDTAGLAEEEFPNNFADDLFPLAGDGDKMSRKPAMNTGAKCRKPTLVPRLATSSKTAALLRRKMFGHREVRPSATGKQTSTSSRMALAKINERRPCVVTDGQTSVPSKMAVVKRIERHLTVVTDEQISLPPKSCAVNRKRKHEQYTSARNCYTSCSRYQTSGVRDSEQEDPSLPKKSKRIPQFQMPPGSLTEQVNALLEEYCCRNSLSVDTCVSLLKQIACLAKCWLPLVHAILGLLKTQDVDLQPKIIKFWADNRGSDSSQRGQAHPCFMTVLETRSTRLLNHLIEADCEGCDRLMLMRTLWKAIFAPSGTGKPDVFYQTALCRLFGSLCGVHGHVEPVRALVFQIVKTGYEHYVSLVLAVAATWPVPLTHCSHTEWTGGLAVVEHVVMRGIVKQPATAVQLGLCFKHLCRWPTALPDSVPLMVELVNKLQQVILQGGFCKSRLAYELMWCIEIMCVSHDVMWTVKNFLERAVRSAVLKWSRKGVKGISPDYVIALCRLVGKVVSPGFKRKHKVLTQLMNVQCRSLLTGVYYDAGVESACIELLLKLAPLKPHMALCVIHAWYTSRPKSGIPWQLRTKILSVRSLIKARANFLKVDTFY